MLKNSELAMLPVVSPRPSTDDFEMKIISQGRAWNKSKEDASNRSRMDIITKLCVFTMLLIMASTMIFMIYVLVRLTKPIYKLNSNINTDKMNNEPKKSRKFSSPFVDLSRKTQELENKLDKLNTSMAQNGKRLAEKLNKSDTKTDQNNQKLEGKQQKLDAILMQRHFEPYLPYGPQSNVPLQLLKTGGWKQCFSLSYDIKLNKKALKKLEISCTAPKIMLACGMSSHATITALAWGSRKKVLSKTTNPFDYEVENGVGWYYYQETSAVTPGDPGVYRNPNYTNPGPDEPIPVTKGSIGFATISDDFTQGSGYLWHALFGYVNHVKSNMGQRMSWRILDYPSSKISIEHYIIRSEAYRTRENCGGNKHFDSRKWERMAFQM